jgi:hypothetical protein
MAAAIVDEEVVELPRHLNEWAKSIPENQIENLPPLNMDFDWVSSVLKINPQQFVYSLGDSVRLTKAVSEDEYGCEIPEGTVGTFEVLISGRTCRCCFDSGSYGYGVVDVLCNITDIAPAEK